MRTVALIFAILFNQLNAQPLSNEEGADVSHAQFVGGAERLSQFFAQNLNYPHEAAVRHIEGAVMVTLVIDTAGVVQNAKVRRGLGHGCDEEALRLVQSMPKWHPALINEKPVASGATVQIDFRLPH